MKIVWLFQICAALVMLSCQNREAKVFSFTQDFNKIEKEYAHDSLMQAKAYYVNKDNVNLDFIINTGADVKENLNLNLVNQIVGKSFDKNPDGKPLVERGVHILVRIYNKFGVKIIEFPLKDYSIKDLN